jgi:hypothetical protein
MQTEDADQAAEKVKERPVTVTLRLNQRQHDALRRVAYEQRTSINKLMMDGLAEVLRRHGR